MKSPRDATAYAGLGDAQFDLGQYQAAHAAYRQAVRYDSRDLQSRTQLELVNDIVGLNPMVRGLSISNRLSRSRKLIERTLTELTFCTSRSLDTLPEAFQTDVAHAKEA